MEIVAVGIAIGVDMGSIVDGIVAVAGAQHVRSTAKSKLAMSVFRFPMLNSIHLAKSTKRPSDIEGLKGA